jgi:hypothetical protein
MIWWWFITKKDGPHGEGLKRRLRVSAVLGRGLTMLAL